MMEQHFTAGKAETDASSDGWDGDRNPLDDPDERQVLYAALDSYR